MNHKINSISIVLSCLLYFPLVLSILADDRSSQQKNELVVFFESSTSEIDQKTFDDIYIKLDPNKNYRIQGYACSQGEKTIEDLIEEAERRAIIVRNLLLKRGFPSNNLTTIAYDYNSECKVTLIATE